MSRKSSLQRLLSPESIAVFGGAPAAQVIRQCRKVGFSGELWPVHPTRAEIEGIRCFATAAELPAAPDASFIGVGPDTAIDVIGQLSRMGAGGAVVYTAGFAEAGEAGRQRQRKLLAAAGSMAFVGPNCHGLINYLDGVALWPDEHGSKRSDRGVAFVLQSGNIGINISMNQRSLPISYLITVGNKADLDLHDYIDALLEDGRVTAIGLYVEGLTDVAAFSAAAMRALDRGVPIAALKAGASALGAAATMSHTSSLAGSDQFYDALFERCGIARCNTLEEFLETLKFLSVCGPLPGDSITSMSCSGGEATLVADHAEALGLTMAHFSEQTEAELHAVLGDRVHIGNPLDYHTYIWGNYEALLGCYSAVLAAGADCNILVMDYPREDVCSIAAWEVAEKALLDAAGTTGARAVILASLFENIPAGVRERLLAAGIAPMQGMRECLFAIRAASRIGTAARRADSVAPLPGPHPVSGRRRSLNEWDSKSALKAHGLPVPEGRLCRADDVAAAAHQVGFPVCLKIVSADISHKTEVGGVRLNIRDLTELAAALDSMKALSGDFLVEKMAPPPVAELIVGVKRDPQFGLGLIVGAGGVLVELLEDAETLLLPASRDEIERALSRLRIMRLVRGFRGRPAGDHAALVDAVASVAAFADAERETLLELDVNPLLVFERGVLAVDALIVSSG